MRSMRRTRRAASLLATFGFALVLGSCSDRVDPVAPEVEAEPSAEFLGGLTGRLFGRSVDVLHRSAPVEEASTSQVVGIAGGVLSLPEAGLYFVVPPGAVLRPTRITVTAPAGDLVGYTFEPHGLRFLLPAVAVQDLSGTDAADDAALLKLLRAAYFEGDLLPSLKALELLPLHVFLGGQANIATFPVRHFSGYVIATN